VPNLASTIVIVNHEAALMMLPTNVHEKFARKVKPPETSWPGVFKKVSNNEY
jgi:hypothetical protein